MKKYKLFAAIILTAMISACDVDKTVRELGVKKVDGAQAIDSPETQAALNEAAQNFEKMAKPADEFIVSTLSIIPHYKISNTQGYYCRMFAFDGYNYSARFNQVIAEIIQEGKKNGAHALVNMSTTAIPFNQMIKEEDSKNAASSNRPENNQIGQPVQFTNSQSIVQVCGDMVEIQSAKP
jgi:hypothetical protein